jgi:hypothetical protein
MCSCLCSGACETICHGSQAQRDVEYRRLFDLGLGAFVPAMLILQLIIIGSTADDFEFHSQYHMPSTTSLWIKFIPGIIVVFYFGCVLALWFIAIPPMRNPRRRVISWNLLAFFFISLICFGASGLLLLDNLSVKMHNYEVIVLRRNNLTHHEEQKKLMPPDALKLWDDDEFAFENDPYALKPIPHSFIVVTLPIDFFLLLILVITLAHYSSDQSKYCNIVAIFCLPDAGGGRNMLDFFAPRVNDDSHVEEEEEDNGF